MSLAIAGIKPGTHFNLGRHHAIRNRNNHSGKCSAACADGVGMKERPILFSGPMIRALLDGSKTMTRRIVKPDDVHYETDGVPGFQDQYGDHHDTVSLYRYGRPGDRLWVRETFRLFDSSECACYDACSCTSYHGKPVYRATADDGESKWKPSIYMPRWASRILLEITSVRMERLQNISEADARAEGVEANNDDGVTYYGPLNAGHADARVAFRWLWESINGAGSWESNPWVWVIEFQRVQP